MGSYRPLVGWLHLVMGALAVVPVLVVTLVFSGIAGAVAAGANDLGSEGVLFGIGIGTLLMVVLIVACCVGLVSLLAGIGVLKGKRWGDVLALISAAFHVLHMPVGTAFAVFTAWVLLFREPPGVLHRVTREGLPGVRST